MKKIKLPSLQHVARQWASTPDKVAQNLEKLALSAPPFSYEPMYSFVRGMLVMGDPVEQVCKAVRESRLHPTARKNFVELLPMIAQYFSIVNPDYALEVAPRFYPVGKELLVPFKPPLIYGRNGDMVLPWFVFWRLNPLVGENLALFVTLASEMMEQDPDLEDSSFRILDFSAPDAKTPRQLTVIDGNQIKRVSEERKNEMLDILVAGYQIAETNLLIRRSTQEKPLIISPDENIGDQLF